MYRSLNAEKIILTVETLNKRIEERFPGSGLKRVCGELHTIAIKSQQRAGWIAKPLRSLRLLVALSITIMVAGLAMIVRGSSLPRNGFDLVGLVQVSEAGLNVVILLVRQFSFWSRPNDALSADARSRQFTNFVRLRSAELTRY